MTNVSFYPVDPNSGRLTDKGKSWKYHLIFEGIEDQIYIFKAHAFIGKSDFLIGKSFLDELERIITSLDTGKMEIVDC